MFLQEKEKLADCLEKIEQIRQIQRKRQVESEFVIWQLRGQLAAMDQNMEEAAYCDGTSNGQVAKCTVVRKIRCILPCQRNWHECTMPPDEGKSRWHVTCGFAISCLRMAT